MGPHILVSQLTLSQLGRQIMRTTLLIAAPPGFSDLSTALQRAPLPLLCNESIQFTTGQLYRHKESFCCGDGVGLVSLFTHTEGEIMIHDAKKNLYPLKKKYKGSWNILILYSYPSWRYDYAQSNDQTFL